MYIAKSCEKLKGVIKMKLLLKDAEPDWDGTANAALECNVNQAEAEGIGQIVTGQKEPYVMIVGEKISCGARVRRITHGKGYLVLDRHLRRDLRLPENHEVQVEPLKPHNAKEIRLGVTKELLQSDEYIELCYTYLDHQPLSKGQNKLIFLFSGQQVPFEIEEVSPSDMSVLTRETKLTFISSKATAGIFFKDIGGLDREIKLIRERVEQPLKYSDRLQNVGIYPPRGVLLLGPPGCGKTMLAKALSNEIGAHFEEISGPEIFAPLYGESEKLLREKFSKAKEKAPSVILIDEIDSIGTSRQEVRGEVERRIVTTLLTEMDGIRELKNVIVVATTNNPNALDPALRRPGRFDYEIRIGVPDVRGRETILKVHTRKMSVKDKDTTIANIAKRAYGYTGADLMLLCREAAYCALQRNLPEGLSKSDLSKIFDLQICFEDFEEARSRIKPTGMREFLVEVPSDMAWDRVGGLGQVKKTLIEEIVKSITNPEAFEKVGINPVRGVLLYGPPGTGKTLLAKIIANQAGANFIPIRGPEVFSKWVGESEQRIRQIFAKAREVSPCIIFFDEIDAITAQRGSSISDGADRVVNQLLTEMDGIESSKGVYVIAATNRKELIDPAFLRPGRFDYHILVPLPDDNARREIFTIHLKKKKVSKDIDIDKLITDTKGFSGAHIAEIDRRAGMQALQETNFDGDLAKITMKHLISAIGTVKGSIENLEKHVGGAEVA
jgi:transitional endoplasmic reticulum ATPase